VGEVFAGRYELVDLLDSGGSGTVWRVWDHRDRTYRAAKVLRQVDSDSLLRFVQETSRRIDHPHVVAPHGWSGEDDRVLFTMRLVAGGSVVHLLADHGALPTAWAAELVAQALDAVQAVHAAGLVHRDVKPGNLLLEATGTDRPHLWLSDFGVAARVGAPRLTHVGTALGTPGYAAPEQLDGADPHPAQDVHALGVVLAQLLTGRAPDASGPALGGPPPGGDPATREVWDLAVRMSGPDPAQRPTVAAARRSLDRVPEGARWPPRAATGADPVEVFDHLPPLPPGWGPEGPGGPGAAPAAPAEPPVAAETAGPRETAGPPAAGRPQVSSPPATRVIRRPAPAEPGRPRAGVPVAAWALAALGVVLLVLAVVVSR
jgi:serine/threonine protein kinase